jgi:uncharacterized Zn-finger protein
LKTGPKLVERAGTVDQNLIAANAQHRYGVRRDDIPLSCPMPGMYLWNSHPRVYLPIEETGEAKCPYCGAQYVLEDEAAQSDNLSQSVDKSGD